MDNLTFIKRYEFNTKAGLRAMILQRKRMKPHDTNVYDGALCGYVFVEKDSVFHKFENYHSPIFKSIWVHGSVSFSGILRDVYDAQGQWALGFDCRHACDLLPDGTHDDGSRQSETSILKYTVCDFSYVVQHCESLARQITIIDKSISDMNNILEPHFEEMFNNISSVTIGGK